ncbi:MAG: hypothetical protein AAFW00_22850 [Bacteroidota bacterium]
MIAPHDILRRGEEIENLIALNQLSQASKLLLSFVRDFDDKGQYKDESIQISQETSQFQAKVASYSNIERKDIRRKLALRMISLIENVQQLEA